MIILKNIQSWTEYISYVPQYPVILNDTIKNNITLSNASPVDDKFNNIIANACLKKDMDTFKNGYDTLLETTGVYLSGGQRQRLGIARALYKNTNLLILDEPTSALDKATELELIQNLINLKNKTIIMVTHKTELIKNFNKIIEI